MRFSSVTTVILSALAVTQAVALFDEVDILSQTALHKLISVDGLWNDKPCNVMNAAVRREWSSLTLSERRKYTDAVLCLMSKPPRLAPDEAPGARSRFDDFVAVHINQTIGIHATGNFLTWHRYFTWAYEQALRNECGYDGHQPYWAWEKYADDPLNSAVFDGSDYSISGNGEYVPHNDTPVTEYENLPAGSGGGCVTTGPFKDMTVNLGPVAPTLQIPDLVPQNGSGLEYNPRCLRRDISRAAAQSTTTADVVGLIKDFTEIGPFQDRMQGDFPNHILGVHTGGHYTVGGDPGGDFFVSPGDPAFYLHHAMIDRTFWIWQNLDPRNRRDVVAGTLTVFNQPPSRNATLDDIVNLGVLAEDQRLGDLLDTTAGPFCYIYT